MPPYRHLCIDVCMQELLGCFFLILKFKHYTLKLQNGNTIIRLSQLLNFKSGLNKYNKQEVHKKRKKSENFCKKEAKKID